MKLAPLILALFASAVFADEPAVNLTRQQLGNAGDPAQSITVGTQSAYPVGDGMYFIPQYLAGYPTAGTIWPRVVNVDCVKSEDGSLLCDGFHWTPDMGRGEYLFVIPHVKEVPPPVIVEKTVEKKVFVEVPVKPKKE